MRRVLVVGDAVIPTGFSRVLHSILGRLHAEFEFHHLGVNYQGDPHSLPWKIYPAGVRGDSYGLGRLEEMIDGIRPELVFLMGDLWVLTQYAGILARRERRVPTIAYFPVESDPVEPDMIGPLLVAADRIVVYTEFAAEQFRSAMRSARQGDSGIPERPVEILGHGMDAEAFYPLVDGQPRAASLLAARRKLFPDQSELDEGFIVLNANRNQPRKRIDITMEAFARFAHDKPRNVMLYLHMARQDEGWDILRLARRLEIADRLLLTRTDNVTPRESDALLNLIYNACDIGVNTACAEGWGLVSFEHAATGAAQIVPRHGSLVELWEDAAEMVEPAFRMVTETTLHNAYFLAAADVAGAMENLYANPERRARVGAACSRNALQPEYNWNTIAGRWSQLFQATMPA